jgi:hypothetical protein
MRGLAACGAAALLMVLGVAGSASADPTLNPSSGVAICNGAIGDPVSCSLDGTSASVQRTPYALITVSATGAPNTGASASLNFDFLVTGGTAGDEVTLGFTTTMLTAFTGQGSGFTQIEWDDSAVSGHHELCSSPLASATACVHGDGVFSDTITFVAVSGDVGHIVFDADVDTNAGGTASASIDPFLFVENDPSGVYSVGISPDVANALPTAGGVPEPAAWALMIGGFALSGAALRRRRALAA